MNLTITHTPAINIVTTLHLVNTSLYLANILLHANNLEALN